MAGPGGVEPPVRVLETRGLPLTDGPKFFSPYVFILTSLFPYDRYVCGIACSISLKPAFPYALFYSCSLYSFGFCK